MKLTQTQNSEVIIIGAGWSGLACAITLVKQGFTVRLLESAQQTGGRARQVQFKHFLSSETIDNGQHIMLGAYHSTLSLFKEIGLSEKDILERQPLELNLLSAKQPFIQLKTKSYPAPLHLLFGFMSMQGLTLNERFKIISMALHLEISCYKLKNDISVKQLLNKHSQSTKIINALWEPLCLATLNTPIEYASAQVFLKVLKDSFSKKNHDSDLLFFRQDLSQLFCLPAGDFINKNGSSIHCEEKVIAVQTDPVESNQFIIQTRKQSKKHSYKSKQVVIATPAYITKTLLKTFSSHKHTVNESLLKPANASLNYQYEPICTVYLQYPSTFSLAHRMIGFYNTTAQWAIDRSLTNQPGLIAVVISGPGQHSRLSHQQLSENIHQELSTCISNLPDLLSYQIIIEKRATFSCRVNIDQQRPQNKTQIPGLYLAGDYTNTHYPSTLEGAIRSGQSAARQIMEKRSHE